MFPTLFCKPDHTGILFRRQTADASGTITIRSLIPELDLHTIHQWVNAPYAKLFWQQDGSFQKLKHTYQHILSHLQAHSFVAFYNDKLVGQADFYAIECDELAQHLPHDKDQCGIHIITLPPKEHPAKRLSLQVLLAFAAFYFSFPQAARLYGEPDHRNEKVHLLIKRAGFSFVKQIRLTNKTANLFCLHRNNF